MFKLATHFPKGAVNKANTNMTKNIPANTPTPMSHFRKLFISDIGKYSF